MKKEVVLAIVLGLVAGVIVTFGIYTANRALQQRAEESTTEQTPSPSATTDSDEANQASEVPSGTDLEIETPETNSISTEDTLTLRGTTFPDATMLILVNASDYLITASNTGKFAVPIKLSAGGNTIVVTAQHPNSNQQAQASRFVVFSTADLDKTTATTSASIKPPTSPSPSPSAQR